MRRVVAPALDVACVLVFVAIGRASHDEAGGVSGFAATAWPFVVGLAAGWVVGRGWRRPEGLVPAGVVVWVSCVALGMALRAVSGQGTAFAFVVVATVFLGVTLLGWRGGARVAGVRSASRQG
ncbi:DUF3054 domain-containing protein [Actinomadura syzygii]|uniref:DUF3054 domain-containing protein n=1 Tax=Actinomadura syzygii TaxID=1427538 RepID=A0A5D0U826_9ACTN|nr:DUF3054 domain-containing protein [Actinomadura syzygii]TYC13866.1 DUF3054 domain-containing protein [Actinomadura syzygii]